MRCAAALLVQPRGALALRAGFADIWRARLLCAPSLNLSARTQRGPQHAASRSQDKARAAVSFLRFQSLVLYIVGSYRREIYKRVCPGAKRKAPMACSKHFAELLINHRKPHGRFSRVLAPQDANFAFLSAWVLTHLCVSLSRGFKVVSSRLPNPLQF